MTMISSCPPGVILIVGALLVGIVSRRLARWVSMAVALVAVASVVSGVSSIEWPTLTSTSLIGFSVQAWSADALSTLFGALFVGVVVLAFTYGWSLARKSEYIASLVYVGAALVVVFAKDFVTLYIFWELMAVASAFLILLSGKTGSQKAGLRYLIVHLVGGLVLLAGIVLHVHQTGDIAIASVSDLSTVASWLMLVGVLVNAAAVPFSSWLSDAYPESTLMGGVILSSVTTKTALYVLIRCFSGADILIWLGVITAIYGVIYGFLENNIRRSLAFGVINQMGFKLAGIGLGGPLAIAGVCAHVVCGVVYNAVLWMSAGSLIQSTDGTDTYTKVAQYRRLNPWIYGPALVGALSIASFPFTGGYVSKTIILKAIEKAHLFMPWIILEVAAIGAIGFITCQFIYFGFHYQSGRTSQAAVFSVGRYPSLVLAMVVGAVLSIGFGMFPNDWLYAHLPNYADFIYLIPHTFTDVYTSMESLVVKLQIFFMAVATSMVVCPILPKLDRVTIDVDWLYRRLLRYMTSMLILLVDVLYQFLDRLGMGLVRGVVYIYNHSLSLLLMIINIPLLRLSSVSINRFQLESRYRTTILNNAFPFVVSGAAIFLVAIGLFIYIS